MSLKEIAARAKVHTSTVSRILNRDPKLSVADKTRKRVLRIAAEIGYVPNPHARRLRARKSAPIKTGNLAVVISEQMHPSGFGPFYAKVYKGLQERAEKLGYHLILTTVPEFGRELPGVLRRQKVDGAVLVGHLDPDFVKRLITHDPKTLPVVLLDNALEHEEVDTVVSGSFLGACRAVRYLLELGHRRIAYVDGWFEADPSLAGRLRAYRQTMTAAGCFDPDLVVRGHGFADRGYSATRQLLDRRPRPTAIFYNNDEAAVDGINAIREHRLRIPDELSVCGFDDIDLAAACRPPLTTVRVDKEKMGQIAAELLVKRLETPSDFYQKVNIPTELLVRKSTAQPRQCV